MLFQNGSQIAAASWRNRNEHPAKCLNVEAFREAQMLLSVHRHLPLNSVTWPEFQALIVAINPDIQEFLTD